MKLYEKLPDGVTVDGKFYKCDFDFRNVLEMMEILDRKDLIQNAREYNAVKCVMKRPKNVSKVLEAIKSVLFEKNKDENKEKTSERITDFDFDAGMIRSAFRQSYGIDLYRDRLHWIEFRELLNAIPEGSRYSEVLSIRSRPIPRATKWNQEERNWLIKAKSNVALPLTEEEKKKKYEKDVSSVFAGMMSFFFGKGSDKPDG